MRISTPLASTERSSDEVRKHLSFSRKSVSLGPTQSYSLTFLALVSKGGDPSADMGRMDSGFSNEPRVTHGRPSTQRTRGTHAMRPERGDPAAAGAVRIGGVRRST
jgi:hypothetical protein